MPRYIQDELYGKGMQVADIRPGETHTLRNLLNAMLVYSGADAAMIIADYAAAAARRTSST